MSTIDPAMTAYHVNADKATVGVIGDRAKVIQNIGAIFNIQSSHEQPRITASLKGRLDPLLRRYALFGGRNKEIERLDTFIHKNNSGYFFITGPSGFGKSALLINWVKELQARNQFTCYHFINRLEGVASERFTVENLCEQLAAFHDLRGTLPESVDRLHTLYARLLRIPPEEGKQLIVVLDGLDDAGDWNVRADLFPHELPSGVFVIFSARTLPDFDWLAILDLSKQAVTLRLDSLDLEGTADLLRKAGQQATRLADNTEFVGKVNTISKGDPFYLHFLAEDIATGIITSDNVETLPLGLDSYFDAWWEQLSQDVEIIRDELYDLVGILVVARGRLRPQDLAMISHTLSKGALIRKELDGKLRRYLAGDRNNGYAICHPRFGNYLERKIFIENEIQKYRTWLLDYCYKWQVHRSQYIFSHYAAHLLDAGYREELYALIDQSWMKAQFAHTYSYRGFADDVELAMVAARQETPHNLMQLLRCCVITATLGSLAIKVPPEMLGLMVQVGQLKQAQGYISLIQDHQRKSNAYLLVYEALLSQQEPQASQTVLEQAVESAQTILDQVTRARTINSIAQTLVRLNKASEAAQLAHRAWTIVQPMEEQTSKARTLSSIAQTYAQLKQVDRALSIIEGITDIEAKASTFSALAQSLESVEDFESVLQKADNIDNRFLKTRVFSNIAQWLARHGNLDKAIAVAELSLVVAESIELESNRWLALRLVAQAFAWARKVDLAVWTAEKITAHTVKVETFSAVAQVLVQNECTHNAIELAERTLIEAQLGKEQANRESVLSNLAQTFALGRKIDRAIIVATMLTEAKYRSSAFHSIAQVLAEMGNIDEALQQVANIEDVFQRPYALSSVVKALAAKHELERAFELTTIIQDERVKAEALDAIVQEAVRTDHGEKARDYVDRALATMNTVVPEHAQVQAFISIAQTLAQMSEYAKAVAIATHALEMTLTLQNSVVQASLQGNIARTFAMAKEVDQALSILDGITDQTAKVAALSGVAQIVASLGEIERAMAIANRGLAVALGIREVDLKAIAISNVAQLFAGLREQTRSLSLIDLVLVDFQAIDDEVLQLQVLGSVTQTLARLGALDRAYGLIQTIQDDTSIDWMLGDMVTPLVQIGATEQAQKLIEQIKDRQVKAQALSNFASELVKVGDIHAASAIAEDALHMLEIVADERVKAQSIRRMAQALAVINKPALINRVEALVKTLTTEGALRQGWSGVALAFALTNECEEATDIVMTMFTNARLNGRETLFQVLEAVVPVLAECDQGQTSSPLLWKIYEDIIDVETWWQN